MAASSEVHATSFMVSKVVIGAEGKWENGNHLQVSGDSYGVGGGEEEQGACEDEMGRNGLQGSGGGGGGIKVQPARGSSHGKGMGACNSRQYEEEAVLPTLRGYEGSHTRETHAQPPPAGAHVHVRSGSAGEVQLHVGLLKADNATSAAAAGAAAASNDSAQPTFPPPSLSHGALLQRLACKGGGATALQLMQSPPPPSYKLPPSPPPPPPPLPLGTDDNLSPEDHGCLSSEGRKSSFFQSTSASAAAAASKDSVQPPPPPAPSCKPHALLQRLVCKGGGTCALQLSQSALSHMQSAPPPLSKLPPSPPPPPPAAVPLAADDKLKVFNLSAEDHCCLSSEGKSSFFQATLNCVSLLYGLGILSSPYAVARAGWMGAIISVLVSTTYGYTAHLMAKCVEYDPACANYQDIAKLTLGKRMRKVITALFYMELTGTLLGYCISMGDNLNYIFPHLSFTVPGLSNRNFMICVVSLIILPSVWLRDLSALSFTSIWCIASSVILLVGVMLGATVNHIGFHHPPPFLKIKGVPVAAGLYAFSYGGTSVFPSIYKSMKDPSKFTQVLALSFFIAIASIGGLGVAGAYMFGDDSKSQVTLSMPLHFISTKIVLWMTILTPIFKFALQLSPITTAVEKQLYKHCKNTHKASNKTLLFVLSTLMRSSVLALIVIVSMILPYFEYIIALVGSSMTIAICMIFPCLFYLKLYWARLPTHTITFIIILVVLGVIVGACGTIVAFGGLITSKTSHSTS